MSEIAPLGLLPSCTPGKFWRPMWSFVACQQLYMQQQFHQWYVHFSGYQRVINFTGVCEEVLVLSGLQYAWRSETASHFRSLGPLPESISALVSFTSQTSNSREIGEFHLLISWRNTQSFVSVGMCITQSRECGLPRANVADDDSGSVE